MFVFRKYDAIATGGFSKDHFIAEDSIFAKKLAKYATVNGKKFGSLWSIQIITRDRKDLDVCTLMRLAYLVHRSLKGKKQNVKELSFWCKPKR